MSRIRPRFTDRFLPKFFFFFFLSFFTHNFGYVQTETWIRVSPGLDTGFKGVLNPRTFQGRESKMVPRWLAFRGGGIGRMWINRGYEKNQTYIEVGERYLDINRFPSLAPSSSSVCPLVTYMPLISMQIDCYRPLRFTVYRSKIAFDFWRSFANVRTADRRLIMNTTWRLNCNAGTARADLCARVMRHYVGRYLYYARIRVSVALR